MASDGTEGDEFDRAGDVGDGDSADSADVATEATSFVWEAELDGEASGRSVGETHEVKGPDDTDDETGGSGNPARRSEAPPTGDARDDGPTPPRTLDPGQYLFTGETVETRVDVGRGWVVATSHRLLTFDPDASGRRFVTVDRPNVVDVRVTGGGGRRVRSSALRAGLYAVVLLVGGLAARSLGLESLFVTNVDVGTTPGVGGLVSLLSLAGALVALLVDLLFVGGAVLGLAALGLGVWYARGRQPTLVVERAGEDALTVPLPSHAVGKRLVDGLERALAEELAVGT
ncbi:hypothetical protein [Salinigranum sp.]|uniref:hypothetical protein n=1 Tax=Salinigranum sp. TaxID=1966351 RepID=UPI003569AB62